MACTNAVRDGDEVYVRLTGAQSFSGYPAEGDL